MFVEHIHTVRNSCDLNAICQITHFKWQFPKQTPLHGHGCFSMRQETPTPNSRLHQQTRTCARSLATVLVYTLHGANSSTKRVHVTRCRTPGVNHSPIEDKPLSPHQPANRLHRHSWSLMLHPQTRWPRTWFPKAECSRTRRFDKCTPEEFTVRPPFD